MKAKPNEQKWEYKPRPKTVLAKCSSCLHSGHYTFTAFPHLYAQVFFELTCNGCKQKGTLVTSDIAKTKPKKSTSEQLPLPLYPRAKKL